MIEEIFAPGRKHTDEEQKRLELSRVDVDDNDPGHGPIDLASGKVTIRVPAERVSPETDEPVPSETTAPAAPDAEGPAPAERPSAS